MINRLWLEVVLLMIAVLVVDIVNAVGIVNMVGIVVGESVVRRRAFNDAAEGAAKGAAKGAAEGAAERVVVRVGWGQSRDRGGSGDRIVGQISGQARGRSYGLLLLHGVHTAVEMGWSARLKM